MAAFYEEYSGQEFEILGVSLDRSKTNWEKAIEKDGITWLQVSDLMGVDSPVATQYGVYSTPTTFLIDSSGVILGKDIEAENLEALLR
ncbi:MAG: TlpA family protein disulfide reductase [Balneola sp.]|nr:MAG: TlpA family protein disulfide reductase [Balneola sp.]